MTHEIPFDQFTLQGARALLERYRNEGVLVAPRMPTGPRNHLGDVDGVGVGHLTLDRDTIQTGCTAIVCGPPDPARGLPCGVAVLNGFAKPAGLIQLAELGVMHGPLLLGGTLAIGHMYIAGMHWACRHASETGRALPTFNPIALECNDGILNDAQAMALQVADAETAIERAYTSIGGDFERGSVGAGRGMSCFGLKGGIGSASRQARAGDNCWPVGALVLANFGKPEDMTLDGVRIGPWLAARLASTAWSGHEGNVPERGSIIMVLATEAPLNSRQLTRLARRAGAGLGRTGAYYGHGSGDIALAFSTADPEIQRVDDATLDPLFRATADAIEGAIVDALQQATSVSGFRGHYRHSLREMLTRLNDELTEDDGNGT